MNNAPIIVIDDDSDDCELFKEACDELNVQNELLIFNHSDKAYEYLSNMTKRPFFIICDINMPLINGLELRQKINADEKMRLAAVPFLYWSTLGKSWIINKAYSLNVQGYFKKPITLSGIKAMVSTIMQYWDMSDHPSD